jgi:hypothetical protein
MRCNMDGADRPQPLGTEWLNDAEWGWVHHSEGWHTVTGTRLNRLPDGTFVVPRGPRGNELPAVPNPALVDVVGHPGLPSRSVTRDEWARRE